MLGGMAEWGRAQPAGHIRPLTLPAAGRLLRDVALNIPPFTDRLSAAIAHYWRTLNEQADRQGAGLDRGRRAAVTGGKQMAKFCDLVQWILTENGIDGIHIYINNQRQIPGFFRPTKDWDMLVVQDRHLIAALEFKSQRGPSFGNNFNNRSEEAIGNAVDLWTAYREEAYGRHAPKPWLGWILLLEESAKSMSPIAVQEPHFPVLAEFQNTSYAMRYELLLRKLVREKLYDAAALLLATEQGGARGEYSEPAADLEMRRLLASLVGHTSAYLAGL